MYVHMYVYFMYTYIHIDAIYTYRKWFDMRREKNTGKNKQMGKSTKGKRKRGKDGNGYNEDREYMGGYGQLLRKGRV